MIKTTTGIAIILLLILGIGIGIAKANTHESRLGSLNQHVQSLDALNLNHLGALHQRSLAVRLRTGLESVDNQALPALNAALKLAALHNAPLADVNLAALHLNLEPRGLQV
ncbi:MAG: hypothetical protein M3379_10725 [Acidobacteriota bacterium]|nr:hypothetical protein [Acidobacteriota bacterium]